MRRHMFDMAFSALFLVSKYPFQWRFNVLTMVLTGLRQLGEQRPEGLRLLFGGYLHSDRRGSQTAPQPTLKQQGEQEHLVQLVD